MLTFGISGRFRRWSNRVAQPESWFCSRPPTSEKAIELEHFGRSCATCDARGIGRPGLRETACREILSRFGTLRSASFALGLLTQLRSSLPSKAGRSGRRPAPRGAVAAGDRIFCRDATANARNARPSRQKKRSRIWIVSPGATLRPRASSNFTRALSLSVPLRAISKRLRLAR